MDQAITPLHNSLDSSRIIGLRRVIPDDIQYERRVVRNSEGCWGWTGLLTTKGYAFWRTGRRVAQRTIYAHRYALEQKLRRPINPEMEVDHLLFHSRVFKSRPS